MRLLFYPTFEGIPEITDHFFRLHWYLHPFRNEIDNVVMLRSSQSVTPGEIPEVLDKSILQLVGGLPICFLEPSCSADIASEVEQADCVLVWLSDDDPETKRVLKGKKILRIDHHRVQHAASFYLKFHEKFPELQDGYLARSEGVFKRIAQRCMSETGYIFGTGPGLSLALERGYDFSDGLCIACNSMVRNHALLERIRPPLIVVADPIFHAGPSSYAAAFREELVAALDKYGADLIVPMRDYHIYLSQLPSRFSDRIAAIPLQNGETPNLNISDSFYVTTTGNILTLFLIPLAATFFKNINIMGCDGRPMEENSYFWGHDKASQFNDKMEDIKKAHPSFFAIDFDDYYITHCNTLESWLTAAEKSGKSIKNITPSYIPALLKRSIPGVGKPVKSGSDSIESTLEVSIVMPAFNAEAHIREAVQSVIDQSFRNWELIVVDDGSTDETWAIVSEFARQDERISLLRNPGKGVSSARNHGVRAAKGALIAFLDADDSMDQGSLAARATALLSDDKKQLVHSCVRFIDERGRDLKFEMGLRRTVTYADMSGNPANINTLMGRSDVIKKFPFPENVSNGEDWMMAARIFRSGVASSYVSGGTATYRIHPKSTVIGDMETHEDALKDVIEWVHSRDDSANVDPKFVRGLPSKNKDKVFAGRILNILIWSIWNCNYEKILGIIRNENVLHEIESASPATLRRRITAAGVRNFSVASTELASISRTKRRSILRAAERGGLAHRAPALYAQFQVVLDDSRSATLSMSQSATRPFYADFGDRLRIKSPRLFRLLQWGRSGLAGERTPTGSGLRGRLPIAFRITQMLVWAGRSAWRHKLSALILFIVCAVLVVAPLVGSGLWPGRYLAWPLAACLLALVMAGAVLREAFRRIVVAQSLEMTAAVRSARQAARKENADLLKRLSQAEETAAELRGWLDSGLSDLVAVTAKQSGEFEAISAAVSRLDESSSELTQGLSVAANDLVSLRKDVDRTVADISADSKTQVQQLAAVSKDLDAVKAQPATLDVVSGMRALRPLWFGMSAIDALKREPEVEHGHAVLMAILADEARGRPDALMGKALIEIGTTREHDPQQSSTQKLALFTGMTGMHFVTVDMDPVNTQSTKGYLRYFNPIAQALTAKGEDYLGTHAGPLDVVYLDAFDFDHGKHSDARQARYEENLDTRISDFECWRMHESCARIIAERMPVGGIVAVDDTWTDEKGDFAGKGKLAVPLLLDAGFEIVARTKMTVGLKRSAMKADA